MVMINNDDLYDKTRRGMTQVCTVPFSYQSPSLLRDSSPYSLSAKSCAPGSHIKELWIQ